MRGWMWAVSTAMLALTVVDAAMSPVQAAYPERQVTIVVGFPPGGGTDATARLLAQKLSEAWKQAVVVENRDGADGTIAANYVARSRPDGYTLMMVNNNFVVTPTTHKQLNYDPIESFAPVTLIGTHPFALAVNPEAIKATTLQELVAYAKTMPGKLNFGSTGVSSGPYLTMALLALKTGMSLNNVNYRGSGPMMTALLGSEIQLTFNPVPPVAQQVAAKKLRALAVSSAVRVQEMPDVPTVAEAAGISDFEMGSWDGIIAPAGTPRDVIAKLNADIVATVKLPDVTGALIRSSTVIINSSPEEFGRYIAANIAKFADLLKNVDLKN